MTAKISARSQQILEIVCFAFSALFIMGYMFYLDEEQFNYQWANSSLNWILLIIYAIPIFVIQFAVSHWLLRKLNVVVKIILSIIIGGIIGVILELLVFSL